MTKHRKPPLPVTPQGTCRWCLKAIEPTLKKDGQPRKIQPTWHKKCLELWWMAVDPTRAVPALIARDGAGCGECGCGSEGRWLSYSAQVDHKIPLWKVRHLPDAERFWYFTLANLWILCMKCHAIKTAKEAAERAHLRELAARNGHGKPRKRKGRAKIKSRGFDKSLRRRFDGTVERR